MTSEHLPKRNQEMLTLVRMDPGTETSVLDDPESLAQIRADITVN